MKTKIIYISGSEIFDIADIRAAFDTVRTALSLDDNTVLFGVPVDNDDAFESKPVSIAPNVQVAESTPEPVIDEPIQTIKNDENSVGSVLDDANATITEVKESVTKTKKSTRQSRAKVVPISPTPDVASETEELSDETNEKNTVPILSVLGVTPNSETETVSPEPVVETESETVDTKPIDVTPVDVSADSTEPTDHSETQQVSIGDMLADDTTPIAEHEKTLEELLESMTPLGEDEKIPTKPATTVDPEPKPEQLKNSDTDTDVTLELLAAEFAESADKIVTPAKPETRGKIGKLKNILPFKKAKRDDSGIMGDLFGWAGVANDEDFTIPGFFANATKK